MCFSATASFTASAIIGTIGVATLAHVRQPRAVLFAATPLLFSIHQFAEGCVWLGFMGEISPAALHRAVVVFQMYAQGILPLLMPLAVLLMEPPGQRRRVIFGLTLIGAIVFAWDMAGLLFWPSQAFVQGGSIAYRNPLTGNLFISLLYILGTCGSLLMSSYRVVRWYGLLNVIVLTIVQLVKAYTFASVWCFYAASMSILLFWQFNRGNIDVDRPGRTITMLGPLRLPRLFREGQSAA